MASQRNHPWLAAAGLSVLLIAALVIGAVRGNPEPRPEYTYGPFLPSVTPTPDTFESPGLPLNPQHQPTPIPPMPELEQTIAELESSTGARVGVAIVPVHRPSTPSSEPWVRGSLLTAPAWHTINVPLGVAAADSAADFDDVADLVDDAIAKDGDGRELWQGLGTPEQAASAVTMQLRQAGDDTTVVNGDYHATPWSLENQARYISTAVCLPSDRQDAIVRMSRITPEQRWGLGELPTTVFKGAVGADDHGFIARQMGTIKLLDGSYLGVSIAAQAASGTRDDAIELVTQLAHLVDEKAGGMTGGC